MPAPCLCYQKGKGCGIILHHTVFSRRSRPQKGRIMLIFCVEYPSLLDTYDPLQDFEAFSYNMGLSLDWTLPSESTITLAGFQIDSAPSARPVSNTNSGTSHSVPSLALLPNPNNSVGQCKIPFFLILY